MFFFEMAGSQSARQTNRHQDTHEKYNRKEKEKEEEGAKAAAAAANEKKLIHIIEPTLQ